MDNEFKTWLNSILSPDTYHLDKYFDDKRIFYRTKWENSWLYSMMNGSTTPCVYKLEHFLTGLDQCLNGKEAFWFQARYHDNIILELDILKKFEYNASEWCGHLIPIHLLEINEAEQGGDNVLGLAPLDQSFLFTISIFPDDFEFSITLRGTNSQVFEFYKHLRSSTDSIRNEGRA